MSATQRLLDTPLALAACSTKAWVAPSDAQQGRPTQILTMIPTMVIIMVTPLLEQIMTTIQASEFKAKCLALMDQVARTGETILVTKNGKPIAELRPHRMPRVKSPFGLHKDQTRILGDIIEPLDTELWEALK